MVKNFINLLFSPENAFFKSARSAKRLPHITLSSFILPFLFVVVGLVFFQHVIVPLLVGDAKQLSKFWDELFLLCVPYPVMIITLFLWVKLFEKRTFYSIGFTNHNKIRKYLFGFGTGLGAMSIIVGLMALADIIKVNQSSIAGPAAIGGVILYLFGYFIQGGSEEIIIRGWQFQVIGTRYKPWLGVLVSSLFFTFMHIFNTGVNVLCIINLFLFSSLLVLYIMNDGSIWSACGWHTAWNWTMGNIFGLQVSGVTDDSNSLLNLSLSGSQLLTGGAFGPEGSIFTTLVLLISTFLWLVIFIEKKVLSKEVKMNEDKIAVHNIMRKINSSWRSGSPENMRIYLDPEIMIKIPGNSGEIIGREALIDSFKEFWTNAQVLEYSESDEYISIIGDRAVVAFKFGMIYQRENYRDKSSGRDIWIFEKKNGNWLAVWRTMIDVNEIRLTEE